MRLTLVFILIYFCAMQCIAQNLTPNPSFEDTVAVKTTQLYKATFWEAPTDGSPDFFVTYNQVAGWQSPSNFIGYQAPKSGAGYFGIRIYPTVPYNAGALRRREYFQVKLNSDSLKKDSIYCLQFFLSLADSSRYASRGQLGVFFSERRIDTSTVFRLPRTPQIIVSPNQYITDKNNWLEYNFTYQASGGETHMIVGNFNDTSAIDTLFVGGGNKLDHFSTYYYFDDFYLGHCDSLPGLLTGISSEGIKGSEVKVYPNPVKDLLTVDYQGAEKIQLQLYNLLGQAVHFDSPSTSSGQAAQCDNCPKQNSKQLQFSVGHLPEGVYVLEIIAGEERISRKIIKE